MKGSARIVLAVAAAAVLGGCAVGDELGWHRQHAAASEVQIASCDAATATLKGRADHDVAHRACVDAKARQHVD